jgi:hypothetical protein
MTRKRGFIAAILASAALAGAATSADAKISASIVIPDSEVIINFNNTGLDWVYAGPIAPNEFGPGNIEPASYRAAEGWRTATVSEWALRPEWTDFVRPGFAAPSPSCGFTDHSSYRFTSEYWSDYAHVDLCDAAAGRFTDGVNGPVAGVPETIYVRTSAGVIAVPEPATWAMMLGGFGLLGSAARRRSRAVVTYA